MTDTTATHIAELNPSTITVGELVEQGGITYRVTEIHQSIHFNGIDAIYFTWTGSEESDVFRSVVNGQGYAGQIRWDSPYRKVSA